MLHRVVFRSPGYAARCIEVESASREGSKTVTMGKYLHSSRNLSPEPLGPALRFRIRLQAALEGPRIRCQSLMHVIPTDPAASAAVVHRAYERIWFCCAALRCTAA